VTLDRALIELAQQGDRDAYARIASMASHRWFALALRIVRDHETARDVVQGALVHIWRDLPSLRDPDSFDAWSRRVVVNACGTARRRARRPVGSIDREPAEPSVGDSQATVALRDELERAFARLSVDQRAVLVLQYYEDLPLAEIAESLGVSEGTVKSRLHAARRAMRAAIEADARLPIRAEGRL
jgi:RNA polymerase sigma-70 factor, ECF subfamily